MQSEVNPKLSDARKAHLLSLKKREDLKQVLIEKFSLKNDDKKTQIAEEVTSFVDKAKLTEKNLLKLEQRIAGDIAVSEYTARTHNSTARRAESAGAAEVTGPSWSALDQYAAYLAGLDTSRAKDQHVRNQQSLKTSLDRQVEEAKARRAKEKRDEITYSEAISKESVQWADYERRVADERRLRAEKEQTELKQTEELRRQRLEEEKRQQRVEEEQMLERIRKEIVQEKTKIERRKEKERVAVKQIMVENEQDRRIKKQEEQVQIQEDIKLMHAYNQMLADQEAKRDAEVHARLERQKRLMEKMQQRVAQESKGRLDEDNDRALKQAQEREERAAILERIKHDRQEQLRLKMVASLQQQVQDKQVKKHHDDQLKTVHAMILREDSEVYKGEEERRRQDRLNKLKAYKVELEHQIAQKRDRKIVGKDEMTETEARINKNLLQVVERVMHEKEVSDVALAHPLEDV